MKQENIPRYLFAEDFEARSEELSMRRSIWTVVSALPELRIESSFRKFCEGLSLTESDVSSAILELLSYNLIFDNHSVQEESTDPKKTVRELLKGSSSALAIEVLGGLNHIDPIPHSRTEIRTRLGELPRMKRNDSIIVGWISDVGDSNASASKKLIKTSVGKALSSKPGTIARSTKAPDRMKGGSSKVEKPKFKLQPIISQIEKLSKGGLEGSVLAYQVFLKVPSKLLRDEGIESLELVDANTEFSDLKLCQAIIRATSEITGYNLKIEGYNKSDALNLVS